MIYGLAVAAVLAAAALTFAFQVHKQASGEIRLMLESFRRESEEWGVERRDLLNRIQHPEVVHPAPVLGFDMPEPESDELEAVGSIRYDANYEYDSALADALTAAAFPDGS